MQINNIIELLRGRSLLPDTFGTDRSSSIREVGLNIVVK